MPSLIRYLLGLGLIVGLAFAGVTVKLGSRTAYGHFRARGGVQLIEGSLEGAWRFVSTRSARLWGQWTAWRAERRAKLAKTQGVKRPAQSPKPTRARPPPQAPVIQSTKGAAQRVQRLKAAAQAIRTPEPPQRKGKRTTIDEPISSRDKKALDDLLSSAVTDD